MASTIQVDTIKDSGGTTVLASDGGGTALTPLPIGFGGTGAATLAAAGLANTPSWSVYLSANQSISDATLTKIQFNTEIYDTDNIYDNTTNYKITIPAGEGGKYYVEGCLFFDDCDAGLYASVKFYKNGAELTAPYFMDQVSGGASADNIFVSFSGLINLAATDTASLYVYQNSGGSGNVRGNWARFSGFKVIGA